MSIGVLSASNTLFAQTIINISNLSGKDSLPVFFDTYIAWQHDDGDEEIYLYNTLNSTKTAVTQNSDDDILPHLGTADLTNSGNYVTLLTWLHWDGSDYEVAYCTVADPTTIYYITNDAVDQGQSFISNLGIVWTQLVSTNKHVFVYYNAITRDASNELGGPAMDNCSSCGLNVNNGKPYWSLAYNVGKYYPNELIRNSNVFSLNYGYCVVNTTSFVQYEDGAGALFQIKEDLMGNNPEVVATVYANNLNTCENISQNLVADYEVRTNGVGIDGLTHVAYFTKTGTEENVVVYKRDWYTIGSVGTTVTVTNDNYPKKNLVAMQNCAAWLQYDGQDWEVYLYDGTTTRKLTNNSTDEDQLSIEYLSQGIPALAWKGMNGNLSEIFYCDPSVLLGIESGIQRSTFDIYPNPVIDDVFYCDGLNEFQSGQLTLINTQGKTVWVKPFLGKGIPYSLKDILDGIYVLKLESAESIVYRKLVLRR